MSVVPPNFEAALLTAARSALFSVPDLTDRYVISVTGEPGAAYWEGNAFRLAHSSKTGSASLPERLSPAAFSLYSPGYLLSLFNAFWVFSYGNHNTTSRNMQARIQDGVRHTTTTQNGIIHKDPDFPAGFPHIPAFIPHLHCVLFPTIGDMDSSRLHRKACFFSQKELHFTGSRERYLPAAAFHIPAPASEG